MTKTNGNEAWVAALRSSKIKFLKDAYPCKIGTMPMMVHVDGRSNLSPGNWIRVKYETGGNWEKVLVTKVYPDGYFFADR